MYECPVESVIPGSIFRYISQRQLRVREHVWMQSFYYDEKPILSNEEFDLLKEELLWEGSKVAVLRYALDA